MKYTEESLKEHYKKNYQYDGTLQSKKGNIFEKYWFKRRFACIFHELKNRIKILDLGCGTGVISEAVSKKFPRSEVYGIDISSWAIEKAKEYNPNSSVKYSVGDAFKTKFKENAFDAIICAEVVEHVLSPDKIIAEAHRILKPGGIIILNVPWKYHPLWAFDWIRGVFSMDYGSEGGEGGKHHEPVHHSFNVSGIRKISKGLKLKKSYLLAFCITLMVVLKK